MKTNLLPLRNLAIKRLVPIFLILLAALSASAQGEWKWANYWTGGEELGSHETNRVVRTAFDDNGNIYVFGSFGGSATLYAQNGTSHFSDNAMIVANNHSGNVLAKFDSLGNLLWHRSIKSLSDDGFPYDMFLQNNKITIAGEYSLHLSNMTYLWFVDTLIDQQCILSYPSGTDHPPYTSGNYSYFATFDLDGNKLENHFVHTIARERLGGFLLNLPLSRRITGANPVCVDSHGNTFIAMSTFYGGSDTLPFTIIVDGDPAKTYQIYLPGSYPDDKMINNMMICKFTPNWELAWMKLMIDHTEGLAPFMLYDSLIPYYRPFLCGMSIDEQDNLYVSGVIMDMHLADENNQYPMRVFWDNTHFAEIADQSLAKKLPFILKYSSDGNIIWANQAYVKNDPNINFYHTPEWSDNFVDNVGVYMLGRADDAGGDHPLFYFDNENNSLQIPTNAHTGFYVKFDKENGSFMKLGQPTGLHTSAFPQAKPAVINNHLIGQFTYDFSQGCMLAYFNTDGQFISADTIYHAADPSVRPLKTIVNNNGGILCDRIATQDLSFGHDLTLNFTEHGNSHAVFAYKYDPSILEPYPVDSTAVPQYDERLSEIRLYPNPATDRVVIESPEGLPVGMVAVTNKSGQLLFLQPATSCRTEISVRDLPSGLYVAHVSTSVGSTAIKFVVKR